MINSAPPIKRRKKMKLKDFLVAQEKYRALKAVIDWFPTLSEEMDSAKTRAMNTKRNFNLDDNSLRSIAENERVKFFFDKQIPELIKSLEEDIKKALDEIEF